MNQLPQDLHLHTTFSSADSAVAQEQTVELIASFRHARRIGISDHFEYLADRSVFETYRLCLYSHGMFVGTEVDGPIWAEQALEYDFDYYLYHCYDDSQSYQGADILLRSGKPVIISHPLFLNTNLNKVPSECLLEINNRYVWRSDWHQKLTPFVERFRFVISSDAHQPNWLGQHVARTVAHRLGVTETLLFKEHPNTSAMSTPPNG